MPDTALTPTSDTANVFMCHGVEVPSSPLLTGRARQQLVKNTYEAHLIKAALAAIKPDDKVVEFGAGLGIVGAILAKQSKPRAVWSYETHPERLPHIRDLHERNDLADRIHLRGANGLLESLAQTENAALPEQLAEIRREIGPDVLILNLEGAELNLIPVAHAFGIRTMVVRFRPDLYGKEGAQQRKRALRRAGWVYVKGASSRMAWVCNSPAQPNPDKPHPQGGLSEQVVGLKNAVIQPRRNGLLSSPSGVQTEDGNDVPLAAHWRHQRRMTLPFPRPDDPIQRLEGRYLWGGIFYRVFSHFMAESLGRLWAASADIGPIDGVAYVMRRPERPKPLSKFQTDLIRAMGIDAPVHLIHAPTEVDELVVPGQGFGLGRIIAGTQRYRDHVASTFGKDIAPNGPEKLYISRSQLRNELGGLLGETVLEEHLRDEGYEIFYPEKHDIPTQIARYKAAKYVIACDGSALHLLAFCVAPDRRVALIARRKSFANKQIRKHLTSFCGQPPLAVRHLKAEWQRPGNARKRNSIGEPDMPAIYTTLRDGGFINGQIAWPELPDELRSAVRARGYEPAD